MAALEEKLAEAVREFPVLYDKSWRDFKDNSKKRLAWDDVAKQVGPQTRIYSSSEYSFICLMFSLVHAGVRKLGAKIVTTTFSFLGSVADVSFVV